MRNLLGRLNARSSDDLVRIARFWQVPLPGTDRGRHVGALYRVMTDIRACRTAWSQLDSPSREMIRALAGPETRPQTIAEITERVGLPEETVRASAVQLFRIGVLAVHGDNQELPVGASPRLFLPRELGQDFRRILDEIDAGDQSDASLRTLLEVRDDPDLEETAVRWGINVIPGLRRHQELVGDILQQVATKSHIDACVQGLKRPARLLWDALNEHDAGGPVDFAEAVDRSGLAIPDSPDDKAVIAGALLRDALIELETTALVLHTYMQDGKRALFIPQEILNPGTVATTMPMRTLQPLDRQMVPEPQPLHPFALAWDVLTIVREIANRGAPVWIPGEPLSVTWQRQLNRRLWFGREEIPPEGYLGMLLYLALGVGVLEPGVHAPGPGADRGAMRPVVSSKVRHWRSLGFVEQTVALRDVWLAADQWIEGREREQIDVWGADWQGFRRRLLGAMKDIDGEEWFMISDVAGRIAEQNPGLIGSTFTAASARGGRNRGDARTAAIAQVIEVELPTAMHWLGFVDIARIEKKGLAVRITDSARLAAGDSRAVLGQPSPGNDEPTLSVDAKGLVTLHHPAPVHIWSLTAFGDAEGLRPEATFQLRPGSVGRALAAGFDLAQITTYLEQQGGEPLPAELVHLLREWTVGYKRVRMRRAAVLTPDFETGIDELRQILENAGLKVIESANVPHGGLVVLLPATGNDGVSAEETLQAALRASGFAGQWAVDERLQ